MKFLVLLLPFLVSCISMKTVVLEPKESPESEQAEVVVSEFKESIPEIKLTSCTVGEETLKGAFNLEKGLHRSEVVKTLGLPNYEASDYRREQTALYGNHNKKENAWCYLVVITYTKDWGVQRVSIFSENTEYTKLEHTFE